MDANTFNKKTLAVAFTAMMVGSVFVAGFAAAHVEDASTSRLAVIGLDDPGASTNAILHWDDDVYCDDDTTPDSDCDEDADTDFYVDLPASGEIVFGNTYDLFFVAIPPSAGGASLVDNEQVSIYWENNATFNEDPDAANFDNASDALVDTETLDIDLDQDHCEAHNFTYNESNEECETDIFAVAFEEISFATGAGSYYLVETNTGEVIGVFIVSQQEDIEVELDPATFTYTYGEAPEIDAVATRDGEGVEDINLESEDDLLPEIEVDPTSSSGRATIDFDDFDALHPPAGTWTVIARQDITTCSEDTLCEDLDEDEFDDSTTGAEPDVFGEATFTVNSNGLTVEPQAEDVLAGFRQSASWLTQFPEAAEDESGLTCDGEEGLDVAFPGSEQEDDSDEDAEGCNNGLLYDEREFEVANVSVRAPNGDRYFLNMTWSEWSAIAGTATPFVFCVDAEEDDDDNDCGFFSSNTWNFDGSDAWDAPLNLTLEDDGAFTLTPNTDFLHPLEIQECIDAGNLLTACDEPTDTLMDGTGTPDYFGALSEDFRVWQQGTYNVTVEISTSGRGTNDDDSSYPLMNITYDATASSDFDVLDEDVKEDYLEAADAPEYETSWELVTGAASDLNLELEIDTAGGTDPDAGVTADSIDVQNLATPIPTQTLFITVYGETIEDHPLCPADFAGACADEDNPDLDVGDDDVAADVLADAEEDFLDGVTVDGDLLPDFDVLSYDAETGLLIITNVTPTQKGNITVTIEHDGDSAMLTIPVETGAQIELDVSEIVVGTETDVTATIHDQFGGLVTTADLTLVDIDGNGVDSFGANFDVSPSSGEISGTGAAGRGLGGEYTYAINPDANTDLLIFALVGEGAEQTYAYALVTVNPAHDLGVELLSDDSAMASVTTPVQLNVTAGWDTDDDEFELSEVDIWFIHEDGAEDFAEDGAEVLTDLEDDGDAFQFTDLDVDVDEGLVFFNATLSPGNYTILVCDVDCTEPESSHDNADDMPTFMVNMFRATFTPEQVANDEDIEENVRVTVRVTDVNGNPANGILESIETTPDNEDWEDLTEGEFDTDTITAVITNGWGNFTGVTGAEVGIVYFSFDPAGSSAEPTASLVDGTFDVVGPNVTITPSTVRIGAVTLVTVQISDFEGNGLAEREIHLCVPGQNDFPTDEDEIEALEDADFVSGDIEEIGDVCPTSATTGEDGSAALAVNPTSTNPIRVYVNARYTGTDIPVLVGAITLTLSPTAPQLGQTVNATATITGVTAGSNAGITIRVVRDGTQVLSQVTDTAGRVTIPAVTAGNYTVTASRTGFEDATATFRVGQVTPPTNETAQFELSNLELPATIAVGSVATVSVDVENTGDTNGTATAVLLVNNAQRDSKSVTLAGGETRTVSYNFTAMVAGTYSVSVRLGNVTLGPQNITVTGGNVTTPTGNVTATTPTTTTPAGTTPTTTTPTTTPATTPETEPTVPGFEVVALLAALGVALLVLRRRS